MSGTRKLRNPVQDSNAKENKCGDIRSNNAVFRPRPRLQMQAPCRGLQQQMPRVHPSCLPYRAFHGEVPSYQRSPLCCFPEPCMNPMEPFYTCESPGPMYCCPEPDYCCIMTNPYEKMCCSPFEPVLYEPCQGLGVFPPALRYRQQGPPRRPTYPKGLTCSPPVPPAYRPVLPLPFDPLKDPRKSCKDPCSDEVAGCDPCCGRPCPVQDRPIPAPPTCGLPAPFMCPLPPPMEECCRPQMFTPIALQNVSPCYCDRDRQETQCFCCYQEPCRQEEFTYSNEIVEGSDEATEIVEGSDEATEIVESSDEATEIVEGSDKATEIVEGSDKATDAYDEQIADNENTENATGVLEQQIADNKKTKNATELLKGEVQSNKRSPHDSKETSKIKPSSRNVAVTVRSQLSQNERSIKPVAANGPAALQLGCGIVPQPMSLSDLPNKSNSNTQRGPSPKYESKINAASKTNKGLPSPTSPKYESKINTASETNKGLPSPTNPEVWLLRDTNENIPGTAPTTVSESLAAYSQLWNNEVTPMYDECLQDQEVQWMDSCDPLPESSKKNLRRVKHGRHRRFRRTPLRSFQKASPSTFSDRIQMDPIRSPTNLAIQSTVVPPPGSESVRMRVTAPYDPNLHMTIESHVVGPEGYTNMNKTQCNVDESEQQQVQINPTGNRRKRRYNYAYGRPSPAPKNAHQF